MNIVNNLVTRYWAATVILLLGVVAGYPWCMPAVIALNLVQIVHFLVRERSITAFPVQVRVAYTALLFLSLAPYMIWVLWMQLVGTTAMVLFQYCFLARCVSLLPWNKREPYSLDLFRRTFFSPPVPGNILQGLDATAAAAARQAPVPPDVSV